jgi:phosphocarrier protein
MKSVIIQNDSGLHARPCSQIAKIVQKVAGEVYLIKDGKPYDAKSILGLMSMGVSKGTEIIIECPDEKVAEELYCFLKDLSE